MNHETGDSLTGDAVSPSHCEGAESLRVIKGLVCNRHPTVYIMDSQIQLCDLGLFHRVNLNLEPLTSNF